MPEKEYGPGWYDVAAELREAKKTHGTSFMLTLHETTARDGRWGLAVTAHLREGATVRQGHGSYGPAFPGNGQKTMAAAVWHALHQLRSNPSGEAVILPPQAEEKELPF